MYTSQRNIYKSLWNCTQNHGRFSHFWTPKILSFPAHCRCEGQELFEEIINRHSFTENDAKDVVRAVLTPIEYLHSLGIVHRDIKFENIMFVKEDNFKELKMCAIKAKTFSLFWGFLV
jgi:serine/threonine protein kinase